VQDEAIHGETVLPAAGGDYRQRAASTRTRPIGSAPQAIVGTVSDRRQLPDRNLAVDPVSVNGDGLLSKPREFSTVELG
jgi:hypothetical protein